MEKKPTVTDEAKKEEAALSFKEKGPARTKFIAIVFTLVAFMLTLTLGFCFATVYVPSMQAAIKSTSWVHWIVLTIGALMYILLYTQAT